ncbi:MAG: hypothetical protein QOD75_2164 [Blastocatellia bacterium]|jgi:hypothetical protein|nr:hypothetical protein [Blastocatellia bacterium]
MPISSRRFLSFAFLFLALCAWPIHDAFMQSATGSKANSDPVYQQIRQKSNTAEDFTGQVATVNGLLLRRDAATFKFNSGEIYFLSPVEGRVTGAVFLGDVEMSLTPPIEAERRSLAIYTGSGLAEHFNRLVMRFTDQTFQEIKETPGVQMGASGAQSARARDAFREIQTLLRKQFHYNLDLRTLGDIYSPQRQGFFMAFPGGGRFDKLAYVIDPLGITDVAPEQVALFSFAEAQPEIWTAFHLNAEYQKGTGTSGQDRRLYDITHHEIETTIRGARIIASDRITLRPLAPGIRVLPFNLYRSLRVSRVRDEQGTELSFVQESKDDDFDFGVILPQALETGKAYKLTVEYEGDDTLKDSGGGNFILVARENWYPNNPVFGDRALFTMAFRHPKEFTFIGTGALAAPDQPDGDLKLTRWTSGETELAVAGFNYGKFRKKDLLDKETGYTIEFYANKDVPDELKDLEVLLDQLDRDKIHITGITGNFKTTSMADMALTDTQNATRIYTAYFGKLPYSRIALTQQPAWNFGQAWPTLIYMPYTAFIDSTQREQLMGAQGGGHTFWRYVGPHETSHQWWGHVIGWSSYRDQWMSEGFAEFSTSLYVQYVRKDMTKFLDFWEEQRRKMTETNQLTKGHKPYTVGPVTQGYRLDSVKTGVIAPFLIYPKGAYILHMIRMLMYDHRGGGDAHFREMMSDLVHTHFNKNVSTEDFKLIVEKHMTPQMDLDKNARMDWFFNSWVYGSEIPAYRLEYQTTGSGLAVKVTQSGVSENFRMLVPFYADFGKGWTRLGAVKMVGNTSVEIPNIPLPQAPKRVTLCALADVLYTSFDTNRK